MGLSVCLRVPFNFCISRTFTGFYLVYGSAVNADEIFRWFMGYAAAAAKLSNYGILDSSAA